MCVCSEPTLLLCMYLLGLYTSELQGYRIVVYLGYFLNEYLPTSAVN